MKRIITITITITIAFIIGYTVLNYSTYRVDNIKIISIDSVTNFYPYYPKVKMKNNNEYMLTGSWGCLFCIGDKSYKEQQKVKLNIITKKNIFNRSYDIIKVSYNDFKL